MCDITTPSVEIVLLAIKLQELALYSRRCHGHHFVTFHDRGYLLFEANTKYISSRELEHQNFHECAVKK